MKKNSFVFILQLLMVAFTISSCSNDASLTKTLQGKYRVKVTEINLKELEKASEQMKTELEKGKKELADNLEQAQKELDKDVNVEIDGKKMNLKDIIGEVGPGLEKVMEGLGDIGSGFGKGISEYLIKNTNFQVDFQDDGVLAVGSDNNTFNFSSKKLRWHIENGKLIIKDKDAGQNSETFSFDLKAKNDKEWELKNDKMSITLNR